MERLYRFVTEYREGWGDGTGRAVHSDPYKALFIFLRHAPINVESQPSIFMTSEGGLELAWDDTQNHDVRVEFTPKDVQYYFSITGSEGSVPLELERMKEFAESFQSLEQKTA